MTRGRSYLILELSIWAISAVSLAARWVRRICLLLHFVVWTLEAMAAAAFMLVAIAGSSAITAVLVTTALVVGRCSVRMIMCVNTIISVTPVIPLPDYLSTEEEQW